MKVGSWSVWSVRNVSLPTGIAVLVVFGAAPLMGWALARERWLILALFAMVGVLPVAIRWPVISTFGLYAFLVPFESVAVLGGGATVTRFIGMLAAAILLGTGLIEGRLSYPPKAALWWALFLLWAVMSAAWTISDPESVLLGMQTIFSLFLLYLVAISVKVSRKELAWVCALTVLGAALAAGWSILYGVEDAYAPATQSGLKGRNTLAVGGQAAAHNAFAVSLMPALALAMGGFIGLQRIGKALSLAAVGVIAAGIFLTMSRGALVGIAAMATVLLYRFRARWPVLVLGCVLLGTAALMPAAFLDRILALADRDASGAGRTGIWAIGIEALGTHGLVGAGFSSFVDVYASTVPLAHGKGARGAHNTYLGTWVELGVVGLTLFLGAIAAHLLAARRAYGGRATASLALRATEAACYGVLVSAFFGDILWKKYFWMPWILLAWSIQESIRRVPQSWIAHQEQGSATREALSPAARR